MEMKDLMDVCLRLMSVGRSLPEAPLPLRPPPQTARQRASLRSAAAAAAPTCLSPAAAAVNEGINFECLRHSSAVLFDRRAAAILLYSRAVRSPRTCFGFARIPQSGSRTGAALWPPLALVRALRRSMSISAVPLRLNTSTSLSIVHGCFGFRAFVA